MNIHSNDPESIEPIHEETTETEHLENIQDVSLEPPQHFDAPLVWRSKDQAADGHNVSNDTWDDEDEDIDPDSIDTDSDEF